MNEHGCGCGNADGGETGRRTASGVLGGAAVDTNAGSNPARQLSVEEYLQYAQSVLLISVKDLVRDRDAEIARLSAVLAERSSALALLADAGECLNAALNPLLTLDPLEIAQRRAHWRVLRSRSRPVPSVAMTPTSATRPYVDAFADAMEAKLAENRHKGDRDGWAHDDPLDLFDRLREEVGELRLALYKPSERDVLREAADVGNFAMMIADVAGGMNPSVNSS